MNKKVVTGLAIAAGLFLYAGNTSQVQAEGTREQGVDLSRYQGNTAVFGSPNDTFALSQIGGYYQGYFIPQTTYKPQVSSTLAQGKRAHTYIYGEFNSTAQADQMLNYYLPRVQTPKGSIVAVDIESGYPRTDLIKYVLAKINKAGYIAMLYSSKSYSSGRFDMYSISKTTPLWLAEYPDYKVRKVPNYQYFPSFNNVQIFQFTSTYNAGGLDGNVDLTGITKSGYKGYHHPSTGGKVPNPIGSDKKQPQAIKDGLNANKTPKSAIKVDDYVKVNFSASRWSNGAGIPSWVKGKSYKVIQVSGNKVLLGGIMSWLNKNDAEILIRSNQSSHPANQTSSVYYTVRAGDNLSSIASRYGVSYMTIANLNGINPNRIYPGQRLLIKKVKAAKTQQSVGRYRIVKSGDTLQYLSYLTGYSVNYLASKNGVANKNNIYPGQRIYY